MKRFIASFIMLTVIFAFSAFATAENSSEQEVIIYKEDKGIQAFLTAYNKLYPDNAITADMVTMYYHHGRNHEDQVQFYINEYEITVSNDSFYSSNSYDISVFFRNHSDNNDGVKELFFTFMRVFDNSLSDETLESYWILQTNDGSSNWDTFGEIYSSTNVNPWKKLVEYTKIEGQITVK